MSHEETGAQFALEELNELDNNAIAGRLLGVLVAGEALLPDDISVIRKLAESRLRDGSSPTLDEALLDSAALRFEARQKIQDVNAEGVIDTATGTIVTGNPHVAREILGRE